MEPFPEIEIDNIRLRQIQPDDIEAVYQGLSNPEVVKYYGVSYSSLEGTQRQMDWYVQLEMENKGIWWAICFENHNALIGAIGLFDIDGKNRKAEIGFWLMPEYWGRGIVSKAAKSICEYGFNTLCLHRIEGFVSVGNRASGKLLTKLGFKLEGVLREHSVKNGSFASLEVYGLLNKLE